MVPCLIDRKGNFFQPLSKPFSQEINWEKLQQRQSWLPKEDDCLKMLIEQRGPKAWSSLARELNTEVHKGMPIRQGKQCRQRYYNHIDPRLKKGQWSTEEDLCILTRQREIGNKWSEISNHLIGRTENQVKNRFKSLQKRGSKQCPKGTDPISYLIQSLEDSQIEIPKEEKLDILSPLIPSGFTPTSFMSYGFNDIGFSSMADRLKSHFGMSYPPPRHNDTPSPSTMLFYHQS